MPDEEHQLIKEAEIYIKDHKHELIERFVDATVYRPVNKPISLFMAGSPGAGKTEVSKRLIERFTGNLPVRIDADDIRVMFPNYSGANSHIFQSACTIGVNKLFDHVLHHNINAILDGTFAYEHAMENIERSLKSQKACSYLLPISRPYRCVEFYQGSRGKRRSQGFPRSFY